jgi:hypothetical protein
MESESGCPSDFALERRRFGELAASGEEAVLIAHVQACSACQRRQAELAGAPSPAIDLDAVWSRAALSPGRPTAARGWRALRWVVPALTGASVAVTALLLLGRPAPETLSKGSGWHLGVIAKTKQGLPLRLDPGAPLTPGDRLRFEVSTPWPSAEIALVLLDSAGQVSQLAPSGERSLALAGGRRVLLEETVELDDHLGPERIMLVACDHQMRIAGLMDSARRALAAAQGDPRQIQDLGTGCHEETFWISKVSQ